MGQRTEHAGGAIMDSAIRRGRREEVLIITGNVADNFQLATGMPPVIVFGASAVRDVLMPADNALLKGLTFTLMSNSSTTTGVLTLKTSGDAALTPAVTIVQNGSVEMIHLGGTGNLGWRRKAQ